ncbi:hypothetical protein BDM02DRAFT_3132119 [Thelephora ganbajun]|uniref:Uncharacterized protein n=1 Tax=Thelephora ganbajun TaxID=370292 RepID=A0ACB6Z2Y6_THEGA|nr:hypothetical protein BDM02DRAFT_3132119 [Thelephora ganbajun]
MDFSDGVGVNPDGGSEGDDWVLSIQLQTVLMRHEDQEHTRKEIRKSMRREDYRDLRVPSRICDKLDGYYVAISGGIEYSRDVAWHAQTSKIKMYQRTAEDLGRKNTSQGVMGLERTSEGGIAVGKASDEDTVVEECRRESGEMGGDPSRPKVSRQGAPEKQQRELRHHRGAFEGQVKISLLESIQFPLLSRFLSQQNLRACVNQALNAVAAGGIGKENSGSMEAERDAIPKSLVQQTLLGAPSTLISNLGHRHPTLHLPFHYSTRDKRLDSLNGGLSPRRVYAMTCRLGFGGEMKIASSLTTSIHLPGLTELPDEFKLIPATEYHRLILLHVRYRKEVGAIASNHQSGILQKKGLNG